MSADGNNDLSESAKMLTDDDQAELGFALALTLAVLFNDAFVCNAHGSRDCARDRTAGRAGGGGCFDVARAQNVE